MPRYPKPVVPNADEIACLATLGFKLHSGYTTTTYASPPLRLVLDSKGWTPKVDGFSAYVTIGRSHPTLLEALAEAADLLDPHCRALVAAHTRALAVLKTIQPFKQETPCQE